MPISTPNRSLEARQSPAPRAAYTTTSRDISIQDIRSLGLLVSFLSPSHEITREFLRKGGLPRKRWSTNGNIEEVDAITAGLSPELTHLLSDSLRVGNTLEKLSRTVLRKVGHVFKLNKEAAGHIRQDISADELDFWERQALVVAYRAVPWKYIESGSVDPAERLRYIR